MKNRWLLLVLCLLLWGALVGGRLNVEKGHYVYSGVKKIVGTAWDPRDVSKVDGAAKKREAESFKDQSYSGKRAFVWPGLKAAQVSWSWLEMLTTTHVVTSYQGDYSWMFSKLNFIAQETPAQDIGYLTGLAPFFLVMGTDYIGANLVLREMQLRAAKNWQVWFWSGFHGMDNLKDNRVAGGFMQQAALLPGSPDYVAPLSLRLLMGNNVSNAMFKEAVKKLDLPEEILEKMKYSRPELFQP